MFRSDETGVADVVKRDVNRGFQPVRPRQRRPFVENGLDLLADHQDCKGTGYRWTLGPAASARRRGGAGPRSWLIVKMWFVLLSNAMVRAKFIV